MTLVGLSIALVFTYAGIAISDESSLLVQAFDNIFAYMEDYIFVLNNSRIIIEMNPAARNWLNTLGVKEEILSFDKLNQELVRLTGSATSIDAVEELDLDYRVTVGQQLSHYNLNQRPIIDQTGRHIGAFAIFSDITRYKLLIERIEQSADIDPLTNLGNRRSYEQALESWDAPSALPFSVILGDVNGLKFVNDNMGHAVGDNLLRTIAQILSGACPDEARAYRIGGDEFVLLLPGTAAADAEAIVGNIHEIIVRSNERLPYHMSIALGVATKETSEQNLRECIALADDNMYRNKQNDRRTGQTRRA